MESVYITMKAVLGKILPEHKRRVFGLRVRSEARKGSETRETAKLRATAEMHETDTIATALEAGAARMKPSHSLAGASSIPSFTSEPLQKFEVPSAIHFWGPYVTWDGLVDEAINIENREAVFSDWWEHAMERVYYRLQTKAGRELWLFRTAEGDFVQGELQSRFAEPS
jgi:hypothetical protein